LINAAGALWRMSFDYAPRTIHWYRTLLRTTLKTSRRKTDETCEAISIRERITPTVWQVHWGYMAATELINLTAYRGSRSTSSKTPALSVGRLSIWESLGFLLQEASESKAIFN
jgi:hypothetical protein